MQVFALCDGFGQNGRYRIFGNVALHVFGSDGASGLYYGQARLAYWTDNVLCFYYTGASLVRGFPGRCE